MLLFLSPEFLAVFSTHFQSSVQRAPCDSFSIFISHCALYIKITFVETRLFYILISTADCVYPLIHFSRITMVSVLQYWCFSFGSYHAILMAYLLESLSRDLLESFSKKFVLGHAGLVRSPRCKYLLGMWRLTCADVHCSVPVHDGYNHITGSLSHSIIVLLEVTLKNTLSPTYLRPCRYRRPRQGRKRTAVGLFKAGSQSRSRQGEEDIGKGGAYYRLS